MHDNAEIKSSSTLNLLLDLVVMATQTACLPQSGFKCILCTTFKATWKFPGCNNY